ncbi:MAG: hypothetical protein IIA19_02425 [Thaumarchaeota archaeon]|nr:hypothetical protein [Nitrososphaerota archaeon]
MSLENTYLSIKEKFGRSLNLEPFCIVKAVDDHRNFWKPKNVRVVLLAESHVHTLMDEYNNSMTYEGFEGLEGCPSNYVKLVYCLGYGEKSLVNVQENSCTSQFWKIFTSCIHQNFHSEFKKILVTKTKNQNQRLQNKISLLEKMKEKGIWLVDASIVAINETSKLSPKIKDEILKISWKQYISKVITDSHPEKIIVIGVNVSKILKNDLEEIDIPYDIQYQPQGIRDPELGKITFENYYKWCNSSLEQKKAQNPNL